MGHGQRAGELQKEDIAFLKLGCFVSAGRAIMPRPATTGWWSVRSHFGGDVVVAGRSVDEESHFVAAVVV